MSIDSMDSLSYPDHRNLHADSKHGNNNSLNIPEIPVPLNIYEQVHQQTMTSALFIPNQRYELLNSNDNGLNNNNNMLRSLPQQYHPTSNDGNTSLLATLQYPPYNPYHKRFNMTPSARAFH